jgi:3-oxoacyl-[acyl-carrier protein] reductase
MADKKSEWYRFPCIEGKIVVVTGGSSGIGRTISMTLGKLGARIAVIDIDAEKGRRTTEELREMGNEGIFSRGDVSIEDDMKRCIDNISKHFGGIDILVNNAAIAQKTSFQELTVEQWEKIIRVNLTGAFICSKVVLQHMLKRGGGSIIMISSGSAITGTGGSASYAAAKGGLNSLVRSLSRELAPKKIRVNGIAPRSIKSELLDRIYTKEYLLQMEKEIPIGRMGTYEDIAHVVVFLASDLSSFITGETILVDGGRTFGALK